MLQELVGKTIEIKINSFNEEKIRGKVLRTDDSWIEIATKKKILLVNITTIRTIVMPS